VAIDFPNSPTVGQVFSYWTWDGVKWVPNTGAYSIVISDTPPSNPTAGQPWWDSSTGQLYIYYSDPNSSEWVVANQQGPQGTQGLVGPAGPTGPSGPNTMPAGVTDGSNAAAGQVGEYIQVINSNLTASVNAGWILATNISLTAGDWDVQGMSYAVVTGGMTNYAIMLSTSTSPGAGWPPATNPFSGAQINISGAANDSIYTGMTRWSLTATTTINLHWLLAAGSSSQAYAAMRARRMR
jgi:hypothetical protein